MEMTDSEIKNKMIYLLLNFSGNGKYLNSKYLQQAIFGEINPANDVKIRNIFREIAEDQFNMPEPAYMFGSTTKGFQVALNEEEMCMAIGYLISKASSLEDRIRKYKRVYKRVTGREYQTELFN